MEERRRAPRHDVGAALADVPANMSVRVLDISIAGVLLQAPRRVSLGTRGTLRFTLAGTPFWADVQVRRVTPASETGSLYRIGAAFVGIRLEHRQLIERFISDD